MPTQLITAPAALAVSLADAKKNLRVDGDDMDDVITGCIEGITEDTEHYLGRSIINQTWRLTLDAFPDVIKLCNPPVVSIDHIKYYDVEGVLRTLNPEDYFLDNANEPSFIVPEKNVTWPDTYDRINSVIVEYVAGYGEDHTATPKAIKNYILARLVQQFDPESKPTKDSVQSNYIDRHVDRYKIWSIG